MINHIIDNIWIGNWQDAKRNEKNFSDIFTVAFDSPYKRDNEHFYSLVDGHHEENYIKLVHSICDLVETRVRRKESDKILVHCVSGFSRAVTVVAGYIITIYSMSLGDTLEYLKNIRPLANPNIELVKLLKEYENTKEIRKY